MNPFFRVDNRLIHGQVISTWMPQLRLKRFLLVSDTVPTSTLQMTMFRMAIPQPVKFGALPVKDAATWLSARRYGTDATMVLFESVADAGRLFDAGCPFPMLNIGNVHHAPGHRAFTNAVYLGPDDLQTLSGLMARGVKIGIRSLPTEVSIDLRQAMGST